MKETLPINTSGWIQLGFKAKEPGKFGYVKYGKMPLKINFIAVYKIIKRLFQKPVKNDEIFKTDLMDSAKGVNDQMKRNIQRIKNKPI